MTIAIIVLFVLVIVEFIAIVSYNTQQDSAIERLEAKLKHYRDTEADHYKLTKEMSNDLLKVTKELAEQSGHTIIVKRDTEFNPFAPLFGKCPFKTIETLHLEKVKKLKVKKGK